MHMYKYLKSNLGMKNKLDDTIYDRIRYHTVCIMVCTDKSRAYIILNI